MPKSKSSRIKALPDEPRRPRGRPQTLEVARRPFSSRLREDYLARLVELAAATGKPQTRLLEEALELYFQQLQKR
jgi:hypothetical protein